ncbi:MAG: ABC transporter substrate-binding protein, partial [candidate division Zixibacteria bacterium]|nr:ABC transporter substrate-binding protein [candidate division Zixibacteria bacterium]
MVKEVSHRYANGMNRLAAGCLLILSLIICGSANSQGLDNVAGTDPEAGLKKAVGSFERGNYERALELFDQLIISFPDDVRYSIFEFMKARALLKLDRLNRAEENFENFVNEFPGSRYIGDALLLLGDIRFLKNDPYGAAYYYIQAYDRLEKRKLKEKARVSFAGVVQNHLSLPKTEKLAENVDRYELAPELLYMKARKETAEGFLERAGNTLEKIREKYPGSKYADPGKGELTGLLSGASEAFTIGILAPLSGGMSQFGVDMLRGIKLALEEFSISNPSTPTRIEIYDNFGTQKETINGVEQLARGGVDVIIGPLKSENAFTAAGLNKYLDIPFIVPAAAANGIASISENIFQITPNSEFIAEAMARYAMNDLMLDEFAIITPSDDLGEDISAAFAQ